MHKVLVYFQRHHGTGEPLWNFPVVLEFDSDIIASEHESVLRANANLFVPEQGMTWTALQRNPPNTRERRIDHLNTLNTKVLLSWLKETRRFGGKLDPTYNNGPVLYYDDEIREVLATRPHVKRKKDRQNKGNTARKSGRKRGRGDR